MTQESYWATHRNAAMRMFEPFRRSLEAFARDHFMRLRYDDHDSPVYLLDWRSVNGFDCYVSLFLWWDQPASFRLYASCQAPSFPISGRVDACDFGWFTAKPNARIFAKRLGKARVWAEGLKDLNARGLDTTRWREELFSENCTIRWSAIVSLGILGDPQAGPGISEALRDADRCMRVSAIEALRKIGDADCLEALQKCLADPSSEVRSAAEYAIQHLQVIRENRQR